MAWVLGVAAIRWLGPMGFLDVPGGRKLHSGVIPRVGGIALGGAVAVGAALGWLQGLIPWSSWLGLLLLFGLGILDDRFSLRARWKAIFGLAIAVGLAGLQAPGMVPAGASFAILGLPLSHDPLVIGGLLAALYWVMPHAYNLIDGADGLALGCSIIVLATLSIAGIPQAFLLGGLLGVFLLNWPTAKCFLGDAGSLTLGLLLALLAAQTFGRTRPDSILWLFAYPLADVCMVVVIRLATRQPLGLGDRNHLHHHWKRTLGSHARLRVPILWLQVALCCSGALLAGVWSLLPLLGLLALVAQVLCFSFHSIRAHRGSSMDAAPHAERDWSEVPVRGISDQA